MSESQNVTLSSLTASVAELSGVTQAVASTVSKVLIQSIIDAVVAGETVRISGLGTFVKAETKERQGRNPSTGESVTYPASHRVSFKASKPLKDAVKA